jgi:hypothetical protein
VIFNGNFLNEKSAARASDTLARKLIANGEIGHKLNFPDEDFEVYPKSTGKALMSDAVKNDAKFQMLGAENYLNKFKVRVNVNAQDANPKPSCSCDPYKKCALKNHPDKRGTNDKLKLCTTLKDFTNCEDNMKFQLLSAENFSKFDFLN